VSELPTCCQFCRDITRLIDRRRPVDDILDYAALDAATLGRRLRAHDNQRAARAVDPDHATRTPAFTQDGLDFGGTP
jgi:hypothetical protein